MEIECRFFATFRTAVGTKTLVREEPEGTTIGELLTTLQEEYDDLDGALINGEIPPQVSIMCNGRDVTHLDDTETELEDGDRISIFPPVAGGTTPDKGEVVGYETERRERTYRGISIRLARNYLIGLGGDPLDERTISGDGWQATLAADTVEIGPSLELTEVTVAFEGDPDSLDDLVPAFSQKALRAGG